MFSEGVGGSKGIDHSTMFINMGIHEPAVSSTFVEHMQEVRWPAGYDRQHMHASDNVVK
jgi:hypothetical protein